ncbi:MAG: hypothetical protein IT448_11030 [Phycisphaerales bacterium]|nr:hypothetical protein [Phycisphaerales bacterium]
MTSLLKQLTTNTAIGQMYLAEELSPSDRTQLQQMIRQDETLAQKIQKIKSLQEGLWCQLRHLDKAEPLTAMGLSRRQLRQRLNQWLSSQRQLQQHSGQDRKKKGLLFAWWMYPAAAVAAVGLALLVWWSALPPESTSFGPLPLANDANVAAPWHRFYQPTYQDDPADVAAVTSLINNAAESDHMDSLRQTERAARALEHL